MTKPPKTKRFFYHYYKQYGCMSVHFEKSCFKVNHIRCEVPTETKWNKTQPNLVMQGFAKEVAVVEEDNQIIAIIR